MDDLAQQLHDKATRGLALSPEEQASLNQWYARQDREESATLARTPSVMQAIHTVQTVTGPTLTIAVPADFAGKQVEVIVQPVEASEKPAAPEREQRFARYILPKPPLTAEQKREFEQNPYPLRGGGGELIDPYEPAVPPEEWEVYRDDSA